MPLRSYDPALARWNRIDPVTHHSLSPYNSFDNNPVFYADPSGGDAWTHIGGGSYQNEDGIVTQDWEMAVSQTAEHFGDNFLAFNFFDYFEPFNGDNNREGQTRPATSYNSYLGEYQTGKLEYYHKGGGDVGWASDIPAGWYSEEAYFELFRGHIRKIGQGEASFQSLENFGFTEDVYLAMLGWAIQAHSYYGGQKRMQGGYINAMGIDSPVFMLASFKAIGALFTRSNSLRAGLVSLSEETFAQALFKGAENIGEYSIYGTKGLVGKTFNRNIFLIEAETKSLSGLRSLINTLEAEALEAGANKISIYGSSVINKGFLNSNIMKRFGYSFEQTKNGVLLQKLLRQ